MPASTLISSYTSQNVSDQGAWIGHNTHAHTNRAQREREIETDRQNRQTDRQTDRQRERERSLSVCWLDLANAYDIVCHMP